jgi:O-succinylbenzoic acid--CoA ligase
VPLQLNELLKNQADDIAGLGKILVGGAQVLPHLEEQIINLGLEYIYLGFGMTETVSHFALRRLGDKDKAYQCLRDVTIGVDSDSRLWVDIPQITEGKLQTNDIVEILGPKRFKWLGRADWVINSGGLKIHPEQVEEAIADLIPFPFVISAQSDDRLGEKLVLVLETTKQPDTNLIETIKERLPKYHAPKAVITLPEFPLTVSGKVSRKSLKKQISN